MKGSVRLKDFHEQIDTLDEHTMDCARALHSLKEEVEAVDWYNQRINASKNEDLQALLKHNRDEEMEHACMALEWLRRNMDGWDAQLKKYLFKDENITEIEEDERKTDSSLNIGNLK
jgi:ferritin-like protein